MGPRSCPRCARCSPARGWAPKPDGHGEHGRADENDVQRRGGRDGFDDERATTIARQVSSAAGDPVVTERATTTVREAVRTADLWLDEVTDLAAPEVDRPGRSRAEWGRGDHAALCDWSSRGRRCVPQVGAAMGKQVGRLGEGGLPEGLLPPASTPRP